MPSIQPNRFVLQSNDGRTRIDYETSNLLGQPTLNLTEGPGPIRHFAGSQIRALSTEIGTLVTVTTRVTIDAGSTSVSILIPAITLKSSADQEAFTTDAIVTTHTGPNSVPQTGPHESYQFVPMKGTASLVMFLLQPAAGTASSGAD